MRRILLVAATIAAALFANTALAAPSCTGITTTVASDDNVPTAFLLTDGNCISAGDKIFGDFAATNAGTGTASFTFADPFGNVTLGFNGAIGPSTVATLHYQVAVNDAALALGWRINGLTKDFTFNAVDGGGFATAELAGTTTPATSPPIGIDCIRTTNPPGGTCPQTAVFAPVDSLVIDETLTMDANAIATGLEDTISQVQLAVPEPGALGLLGLGLVGLGLVRARSKNAR